MANTHPNTLQPYHPDPAEAPVRSLATVHEFDVQDVIARIVKVQQVMKQAMREGEHYGVIPGATKPSLLKPGAELLCMVFRLDPQYGIKETYEGDHLTVGSTCTLFHIPTTMRMGSGMGACSTKEKKYKWRTAKRQCPKCGAEAIFRSKYPPKDKRLGTELGWYCFAKQGGCGLEFAAQDSAILNQPTGQILNPDLPDLWNTVTKMSNKRALIAAVLNVTAASDIFTQDLEDYPELVKGQAPPKGKGKPALNNEIEPEDDEEVIGDEPGVNEADEARILAEHAAVKAARQPKPSPKPEPKPEPEPAPRKAAPVSEWVEAFAFPELTPTGLKLLWDGCTAQDVWRTRSMDEKAQLIQAKDAAKARLGL